MLLRACMRARNSRVTVAVADLCFLLGLSCSRANVSLNILGVIYVCGIGDVDITLQCLVSTEFVAWMQRGFLPINVACLALLCISNGNDFELNWIEWYAILPSLTDKTTTADFQSECNHATSWKIWSHIIFNCPKSIISHQRIFVIDVIE